ncbi:MAG: FAD-binding oxidoreductase, partial [Muribaculaceae bacterium]
MKHLLDFIIKSKSTAGGSTIITLAPADNAQLPEILPGQFVEIKVENSPATMLRRPISVCDVTPDGHLVLLIKPVGDGTRHLCSLPIGAKINILLPLGHGFTP